MSKILSEEELDAMALCGAGWLSEKSLDRLIASHRQLQAERDGLLEWKKIILGTGTEQEAVVRMAATEYTQTAIASWKLTNEKLAKEIDALKAELVEAKWARGDFEQAPCFLCGYNGSGYYQP